MGGIDLHPSSYNLPNSRKYLPVQHPHHPAYSSDPGQHKRSCGEQINISIILRVRSQIEINYILDRICNIEILFRKRKILLEFNCWHQWRRSTNFLLNLSDIKDARQKLDGYWRFLNQNLEDSFRMN